MTLIQKESPNIDELHQKAMQLADEAFYAKKENDLGNAQSKYLAAFEYEKTAAMLLINDYEQEQTRSVLFRSAACLLLNLPYTKEEYFRQAEQMVAHGLSGNPPEEIAEELRACLNFVFDDENYSFFDETSFKNQSLASAK